MFDDDDPEFMLWLRTVRELVAEGEPIRDAIEGANLVLRAHRRGRSGADASESGMHQRPQPYRRRGTG